VVAVIGEAEVGAEVSASGETGDFVDSYRAFTNVLNRLRRQYLDLKGESQRQATALAEANESLQALTRRNHAAMEFLNSVLCSVSTGIIVVDKDRRITHLNPAAESLFGVAVEDAPGRLLQDVVRLDSLSGSSARRAAVDSAVSPRGVEVTFTDNDVEKTYLWSSAPLLNKHDESFGSVEAFQDITETKLMERKLTRMESLAAIGEMAATVAHQVRNPLVSVKGFASLISAQPAKGSKNKAHAELILKGVNNLERVIDALLRFSRTESLSLRPTNLNRYLRKIVRQYNERSGKDDNLTGPTGPTGTVSFSASDDKLVVDIDQLVFREAIVNILRNAHEAASEPVTCHVVVGNREPQVETVCFEIRDNGPGIQPDVRRDIFRPFFTTKASGSGLGLPLSRKLINAHGGEIAVESAPGRGTTFRIRLPLSAATSLPSERQSMDTLEQSL